MSLKVFRASERQIVPATRFHRDRPNRVMEAQGYIKALYAAMADMSRYERNVVAGRVVALAERLREPMHGPRSRSA